MDWTSKDLPTAWKAFRQHCEFMFGGPLKRKIEEEKCNYLMIWVGDKGRDIYNTWELTADEVKKLETYYTRFETYEAQIDQGVCQVSISFESATSR